MSVLSAYRSLNAEQKNALRTKKLDLNRPLPEMLEFLRPLGACDAMADKVRTKLGCSTGIGVVLIVVAVILFSNIGWSWITGILLVALIAAVVGFGFLWGWTKSIDVSNNFREFALPVLTVLRDDIDPTQPVHAHLDLTSPTAPSKRQSESAPYKDGRYHKIIDRMYRDDWMSVDALLVDGTKLSWSVSDSIRERAKTKRNPRGKIKTKTKYSKKSDIEVSMGLRNKTYELAEPAGGEMSSDGKRMNVRVSRQVKTPSLDPISPRELLDLVADVFRSARPAKEAGA